MTLGFEVFVQLVIAAIATAPWSSVNVDPSSRLTLVGFELFLGAKLTWLCECSCAVSSSCAVKPTGSLAGNVPSTAASTLERSCDA